MCLKKCQWLTWRRFSQLLLSVVGVLAATVLHAQTYYSWRATTSNNPFLSMTNTFWPTGQAACDNALSLYAQWLPTQNDATFTYHYISGYCLYGGGATAGTPTSTVSGSMTFRITHQQVINRTGEIRTFVDGNPNSAILLAGIAGDCSSGSGCGAYVSAKPLPPAQCGSSCNGVGDPINPLVGSVYDSRTDIPDSPVTLGFGRFFNSTDSSDVRMGTGWRPVFSRSIAIKYSVVVTQPYIQSPDNSSIYMTPSAACVNGFAEIQARVPSWSGATALYSSGTCQLSENNVSIGSVPIYIQAGALAPAAAPIAYDVARDDGQVIRFFVVNGVIATPPGTRLKLTQTTSGFTVTDGTDNIEQYDSNGKLQSVTSRSGVVQTMSYDGVGRLSAVTDSFGHQLILSYDAQGKLSSVSQQ